MNRLARHLVTVVTGERRRTRRGGRRRTDYEPNLGWVRVMAIALPIALLDWGVKWVVAATVPLDQLRIVTDRVALWHVQNPALILGLHSDLPLGARKVMLSLYSSIALILLLGVLARGHRLLPHRRKWAWLFLGMVAGGMMGNLGERVLHWRVTDFLSFRWGDLWLPPGNIADLAIVLSLPLALCVLLFELEARALRRPVAGRSEEEVAGSSARAAPLET